MTMSSLCERVSQLSSVKGLGLKTFYHLYAHFGGIDEIFSADFEAYVAAGIKPLMARALAELGDSLAAGSVPHTTTKLQCWASQESHSILCIADSHYPDMLRQVFCPPPIIYVRGSVASLDLPCLAVVGSRKPSIAGQQHAYSFARDLSLQGYNIVSGLALGVDTQAHKGALSASGITCAVLGTGLDVIYPRQNQGLSEQIVEQGALLSEMPLGALPVPANFPRRNRLVSGLSQGALIVEAGLKSGSLITANYAVEQNREVYVIPGPIDSPTAAGCNALIKQGAQLVSCVEDMLGDSCMAALPRHGGQTDLLHLSVEKPLCPSLNEQEAQVISCLAYQCTSFDLVMNACDLAVGDLMQVLVNLELKGAISSVPGGYQRVKSVNSAH